MHDCCFTNVLKVIDVLQRNSFVCSEIDEGCTRPFLGSYTLGDVYNTRPVTFFARSGDIYSIPYTYNGTSGESSIFRVEKVKGNCVTVQLLISNPDTSATTRPYVATGNFATINLDCVCVLQCLADVIVDNV